MRPLVATLVLALGLLADSTEAAEWRTLKTWRGTGSVTTESFATAGPEWRIRWTARPIPQPVLPGLSTDGQTGMLSVFVFDATSRLVVDVFNSGQPVDPEGQSYVHASPGRYYLSIVPLEVRWTVTVEAPGP